MRRVLKDEQDLVKYTRWEYSPCKSLYVRGPRGAGRSGCWSISASVEKCSRDAVGPFLKGPVSDAGFQC